MAYLGHRAMLVKLAIPGSSGSALEALNKKRLDSAQEFVRAQLRSKNLELCRAALCLLRSGPLCQHKPSSRLYLCDVGKNLDLDATQKCRKASGQIL